MGDVLEGRVGPKHVTLRGLCVLSYEAVTTKSVGSWDHIGSDRHSLMGQRGVNETRQA